MASAVWTLVLASLASLATATSADDLSEVDPRIFFANASQYTVSVESLVGTVLAALALLMLGAGVISLLTLFGGGGEEELGYYSGSSGYSGGSSGDSYSSYSARSLASGGLWDTLKAIDWITLAEELYNTEDLTSRQCQQQLVCELKRSAPAWGQTARAASGATDYISYIKLLRLPEPVHQLLDQYDEAASAGRDGDAQCGSQFYCGVSMRNLLDRLSPSKV